MQPTVFRPPTAARAGEASATLAECARLTGSTLVAADAAADFTTPILQDHVAALGAAARRADYSADELLALLEALVRSALAPTATPCLADVVLVYLWRVARRAHEQRPLVRAA